MFRELAEAHPNESLLEINFFNNPGGFYYTLKDKNSHERIKSPVEFKVFQVAMKIAKDYDIDTRNECFDGSYGTEYAFYLDLDN